MGKLIRFNSQVFNTPLLLHEAKIHEIVKVLDDREAGDSDLNISAFEASNGIKDNQSYQNITYHNESIAVIELTGIIDKRANAWQKWSGGSSADMFRKDFTKLLNDPKIKHIIIDVETVGGSVYGTGLLSELIFSARGIKPIYAVVNEYAFSAGVWIATCADKVFMASNEASIGSIGVFTVLTEPANPDSEGNKHFFVGAGKYKGIGSQGREINAEDLSQIQSKVDKIYDQFIATVARNRNLDEKYVREELADAKIFDANEAIQLKLADGIKSIDELILELKNQNNEGNNEMKFSTQQISNIKTLSGIEISEDGEKFDEALNAISVSIATSKDENEKLSNEIESLKAKDQDEAIKAEAEARKSVLETALNEKKITAGQKEAYETDESLKALDSSQLTAIFSQINKPVADQTQFETPEASSDFETEKEALIAKAETENWSVVKMSKELRLLEKKYN